MCWMESGVGMRETEKAISNNGEYRGVLFTVGMSDHPLNVFGSFFRLILVLPKKETSSQNVLIFSPFFGIVREVRRLLKKW